MSESTDFGARLRLAREARGVSLRDIAATTKISRTALEALERNDIAQLPGGIFTRAFVRSYAAEVGLDPETTVRELLAAFPVDGVADGSPYAVDRDKDEAFENQRQMAGAWLWLGGLSVPVIGLILYFSMAGAGTADRVEMGPVAAPLRTALPPSPTDEAPTPSVLTPEVESDRLRLGIVPVGPCWVSVVADGELVLSRLMQPGERERIEAREEVVLNVGDAGAFAFTLNGQTGVRLGAAGEGVTAHINRENFRDYLAP